MRGGPEATRRRAAQRSPAMSEIRFPGAEVISLQQPKPRPSGRSRGGSSKAEKRRKRRATPKYRHLHASRERIRVEAFNSAFANLRALLPTLPRDKKLSKIEILRLSIAYIRYLADLVAIE